MVTPPRPKLDPAIQVRPGTDLAGAWDRYEIFEALHHDLAICNPMTSAELDEVIDAAIDDGDALVDYACGNGELLYRAVACGAARGVGVDLSPWMISAAARQAGERDPAARLTWVLGEARDYMPPESVDVAVCIGAEWVWHDFRGTATALASRLAPGGVAVIGAARLHLDADLDQVRSTHGLIETIDDQRGILHERGLVPIYRVDPDDNGWDRYLAKTARAAEAWANQFPGEASDEWLAEQADWQRARDRDRGVIGWSVWIARAEAPIP